MKIRKVIGISQYIVEPFQRSNLLIAQRTIHGMVYSAMKLFMEVNPALFDECSQVYTEETSNTEQKKQSRESRWERIAELARENQGNVGSTSKPAALESVDETTERLREFEKLQIHDGPAPAHGTPA